MATTVDPDTEERLRVWTGRVLLSAGDPGPLPLSDPVIVSDFLRRHGVDLCVTHFLEQFAPTRLFPLPAPDTHRAIAVDMAANHEAARIMHALNGRFKQPPLVYKGQALAHTLYTQSWLRPRGDIDILITRPMLSALVREMELLGYEQVLSTDGDLIMTQTSMRRIFSGIEHVWDIHWELSNRPAFSGVLSYPELRRSAIQVRINDTAFLAPCDADNLLIACLHLIGHHGGAVRMIWLYDIHLLTAALRDLDRQQFLDKAMHSRPLRDACHAALELTARYLPTARPDELRRTLAPGAAARRTTAKPYLAHLAEDARAVGQGKRLRFMRQHVFPSRDYMVRRFHVRHRWQLPFWYAIRIGRALPKLFRRR